MVVRQEVKNQGRKQQAVCVCVCVCETQKKDSERKREGLPLLWSLCLLC